MSKVRSKDLIPDAHIRDLQAIVKGEAHPSMSFPVGLEVRDERHHDLMTLGLQARVNVVILVVAVIRVAILATNRGTAQAVLHASAEPVAAQVFPVSDSLGTIGVGEREACIGVAALDVKQRARSDLSAKASTDVNIAVGGELALSPVTRRSVSVTFALESEISASRPTRALPRS